jgi:hypothetical protein
VPEERIFLFAGKKYFKEDPEDEDAPPKTFKATTGD